MIAEEDKFVYYWTDGTVHDYDNWASGEPLSPKYYPCVYADMEDGKWSTAKCDQSLGWVCKKPAKDEAKPTGKYIYPKM